MLKFQEDECDCRLALHLILLLQVATAAKEEKKRAKKKKKAKVCLLARPGLRCHVDDSCATQPCRSQLPYGLSASDVLECKHAIAYVCHRS